MFFFIFILYSCNSRYIMEIEIDTTITNEIIKLNIKTDQDQFEKLFKIIDDFASTNGYSSVYTFNLSSCKINNYRRYFHKEYYIAIECNGDYDSKIFHLKMLREHATIFLEPEEFTLHKTEILNSIREQFPDKSLKILQEQIGRTNLIKRAHRNRETH